MILRTRGAPNPSFLCILINKNVHCLITMGVIVAAIKPVLLAFLTSHAVKKLVVDLLAALAAETENKLDDAAVDAVREALL